jgi:hypothetical protein
VKIRAGWIVKLVKERGQIAAISQWQPNDEIYAVGSGQIMERLQLRDGGGNVDMEQLASGAGRFSKKDGNRANDEN